LRDCNFQFSEQHSYYPALQIRKLQLAEIESADPELNLFR